MGDLFLETGSSLLSQTVALRQLQSPPAPRLRPTWRHPVDPAVQRCTVRNIATSRRMSRELSSQQSRPQGEGCRSAWLLLNARRDAERPGDAGHFLADESSGEQTPDNADPMQKSLSASQGEVIR